MSISAIRYFFNADSSENESSDRDITGTGRSLKMGTKIRPSRVDITSWEGQRIDRENIGRCSGNNCGYGLDKAGIGAM